MADGLGNKHEEDTFLVVVISVQKYISLDFLCDAGSLKMYP